MSECPICGKDIDLSRYLVAAEVQGKDGPRLAHIEDCPTDDLKRMLITSSRRQLEFFQDASKLGETLSFQNIQEFERKYGKYEELSQTLSDHEIAIVAIIDELKKRLRNP